MTPERDGYVAVARPEAGAEVWEALRRDAGVRAVVLAGDFSADQERVTPREAGLGKPVVAAVGGECRGEGLALVADCDLVVAAPEARFCDPRVARGALALRGALQLARRIPLEAVLRMALLGGAESLSAERARELGLVGEVVPGSRLLGRARELAASIAQHSPGAVFYTRHAVWRGLDAGLESALRATWDLMGRYHRAAPDFAEGARAFVERRPAKWTYTPPPEEGA